MDKFEQLKEILEAMDIEFTAQPSDNPTEKDHWIYLPKNYGFQVHPQGRYITLTRGNLGYIIGGDHHDPIKAVKHLKSLLKEAKNVNQTPDHSCQH